MNFLLSVAFWTACYALCGLVGGWFGNRLGILSIAHGAVIGTGAYAFAIASRSGAPGWVSLAAGCLLGAVAGWAVALLSERIIGEEFALASFGIQVLWTSLVRNLPGLTGGPLGIAGIRALTIPGIASAPLSHCLLAAFSAGAFAWLLARVARSPFMVAAAFVKRSRELAVTVGINSSWIRSQAGLAYGLCLGVVGALLASFVTFVGPDDFGTEASVSVLAIAFMMKKEGFCDALRGSVVIVSLPQLLRLAGISAARVGFAEILVSGVIVMASQVGWRGRRVRS